MYLARWLPFCLAIPLLAQSVEFNRDVRPILSDRCFACHGPDGGNRKSKWRLDQEQSAKDGRIVVPGKPEASELWKRITSTDKVRRMPPAYAGHAALTTAESAVLKRWIEAGAPYEPHWSLVPPKLRPVPQGQNAIDYFIRARLKAEGLQPSPQADRGTLIRRASFDLTGLPPTPAELEAFEKDTSANAYEKVIDRLLASPRYGERMAYRWMEAARYSDTNGYQSDGPREMWRWRDWVIEAFNSNKRFDTFTVEQLAGDLLPNATLDQRIATAFNRNHRTSAEGGIVPEEFRLEYVADRVETTSTVWLGLTVGCARCHDHKYDPIPQRDFYRLSAFFNNVPEKGLVYNFGNDEPMIKAPTREQARTLASLETERTNAEAQWQQIAPEVAAAQAKWEHKLAKKRKTPDWEPPGALVAIDLLGVDGHFDNKRFVERPKNTVKLNYLDPVTFSAKIRPETPNGAILSVADDYFEGQGHALYLLEGKLRLHIIFRWTDIGMRVETVDPLPLQQWSHVAVTYDGSRYAKGVHMYVDGREQPLKILFDELNYPMNFALPLRVGAGGGLRFQGDITAVRVYKRELTAKEVSTLPLTQSTAAIAALPERSAAQQAKLDLAFLQTGLPPKLRKVREASLLATRKHDEFERIIPTVMVMQDAPVPRDTFVLKRGAYDNPGDKVTAGTLTVLPAMHTTNQPVNRLALASWLVSRENPLPARVIVNRFWQMIFGTGLVKTVEDFGSQGEWPIHRDLLDQLAVQFVNSGWDVKALLKSMLMSETYQQSAKVTPELLQRDPENRLLARGPRFRLSSEMIRDNALAVSGLLVEKVGGPSVKPYQPAGLWQELGSGKGYTPDKGDGLYRRSLYTYWKRTVAPPSMVNFDSPNRETCTVREVRTDTPLQALTLMNDTIFLEASRHLAEKLLQEKTPEARITLLYRTALSRAPQPREQALVMKSLEQFRAYYGGHPKEAEKLLAVGDSPRDRKLSAAETAAYASVASMVLNLDEAVTKQ